MDKFTPTPFKISTDELFDKFKEENKHKIPEDVRVERVSKNFGDDHTGVMIHAYTLSLGLYLPFHPLIREILSKLNLAPIQLGPNCWRIIFGILALNRICNINLGWPEFCHCYVAKQNSGAASLYYFSPRNKKSSLVTNLPSSEKGDWKEELIYLKGNWERRTGDPSDVHVFPKTKADGRPIGAVKHQDWKVNQEDLQKALSYQNRDWRYLLDPDNWGTVAVEEAVSSKMQSRGKQLIQDCGVAHSGGLIKERTPPINVQSIPLLKKQKLNINHSHSTFESVNNHGLQEEGSTQDIVRTRSRFLHSAQEAAAATQMFHSHQNLPNSHASMPLAPSLPRHRLGDNNPKAGTGIDLNFNWMELLHHLCLGNDIDNHQGSEKHLSDPYLKAIEHLEHKPFEEVCLEAAQSVGKIGILMVYLMDRIKCQNAKIKDLQTTNERLKKELEESQLAVGKDALRFENPRASQKESQLDVKKELRNMENFFLLQIRSLKKDNAEIMGQLTQFREMNSRQQNQPHCPAFWPMSAASEKEMDGLFSMLHERYSTNPNQISKNGIEIGCTSRVNTNTNLPGDDGLGLTVEASLGSRQSGHDERTNQ